MLFLSLGAIFSDRGLVVRVLNFVFALHPPCDDVACFAGQVFVATPHLLVDAADPGLLWEAVASIQLKDGASDGGADHLFLCAGGGSKGLGGAGGASTSRTSRTLCFTPPSPLFHVSVARQTRLGRRLAAVVRDGWPGQMRLPTLWQNIFSLKTTTFSVAAADDRCGTLNILAKKGERVFHPQV